MENTIDKYKLNLYCRCLECKKKKYDGKQAHSCEAYPKQNGIPPEVWNGKNAECKYFEAKHPS